MLASRTEKTMNANRTKISIYLDILGWSPRQLSDILGINERGVWRWLNGQNETPDKILDWLKRLSSFHEQNSLPEGWAPNAALSNSEDQ